MKAFSILLLLLSTSLYSKEVSVELPLNSYKELISRGLKYKVQNFGKKVELRLKEAELNSLSAALHAHTGRCGGFVTKSVEKNKKKKLLKGWDDNRYTVDYRVTKETLVKPLLENVQESRLLSLMAWFSSYKTRYYSSPEGIKAMEDLAKNWSKLTENRSDVKVELIDHKEWKQKSVVLTIKGSTDENIIVGGHGDSINSDDEGPHSHSPGLDDNASGIAVITEIIRVLIESNYKPHHNLQFMAFAAEEVGLRGSMDISKRYDEKVKKIRGMLNIDGTNFKGSEDINLSIISDETDKEQNQFLGTLVDKYLGVPWGYDKCNYACSDHYSFSYRNFRSSFIYESRVAEENPIIIICV